MVAKMYLERSWSHTFIKIPTGIDHGDQRFKRSSNAEALLEYDWVLEFDIKGLFDNIDHDLLMRAVRRHTDCKWMLLYIERWLKAPFQTGDGTVRERTKGTPQGGVLSPLLANLSFTMCLINGWSEIIRRFPFAVMLMMVLVHCHTEEEALKMKEVLEARFEECKLELHPEKTRVIYCKDDDRRREHPHTKFDFLGFTFRPRRSRNRWGKHFINFSPAVSNEAGKAMRQETRRWRLHLRSDKSLEDLSRMFSPVVRGWINYYGNFYKSALYPTLHHLNRILVRWAMWKFKRLKRHQRRAEHWFRENCPKGTQAISALADGHQTSGWMMGAR